MRHESLRRQELELHSTPTFHWQMTNGKSHDLLLFGHVFFFLNIDNNWNIEIVTLTANFRYHGCFVQSVLISSWYYHCLPTHPSLPPPLLNDGQNWIHTMHVQWDRTLQNKHRLLILLADHANPMLIEWILRRVGPANISFLYKLQELIYTWFTNKLQQLTPAWFTIS